MYGFLPHFIKFTWNSYQLPFYRNQVICFSVLNFSWSFLAEWPPNALCPHGSWLPSCQQYWQKKVGLFRGFLPSFWSKTCMFGIWLLQISKVYFSPVQQWLYERAKSFHRLVSVKTYSRGYPGSRAYKGDITIHCFKSVKTIHLLDMFWWTVIALCLINKHPFLTGYCR